MESHTGSSGVDRYADYNGPTSNPNGHLVFELSPKNRFLTPDWPFMTLDNMTVIFQNVPRFIYILPQNMNHVRLSYIELSHFLFWGFLLYLPP